MALLRLSWYPIASIGIVFWFVACGDGGSGGRGVSEDDAAASTHDGSVEDDRRRDGGSGKDAGVDASVGEGDEDGSAGEDAAADGDASVDDEDASEGGCPEDEPADECGVCGGDGSSCAPNPFAGTYAVRTQLYARQKTTIDETPIDLVSKMSLLSLVEIHENGEVDEHYCFLELTSTDGFYIWTDPAAVQGTPDTTVKLEARDGAYVRPLDEHRTDFSWSEAAQPEDCVAGAEHSSGCLCPSDQELPTDPRDCRVLDADGDGTPGGNLYLDLEEPEDPSTDRGLASLSVVASLGVEWRLQEQQDEGVIVGDVEGGLEQSQLSLSVGDLGNFMVAPVRNAMCPGELGHVELVKGDFDCAAIVAGRADGIFNLELDGPPPEAQDCPDPTCSVDSDQDGAGDCEDECPADPDKVEQGACGCGMPETDGCEAAI